jgi:3-oxoacyl-[acyl-carrier protein] reductase
MVKTALVCGSSQGIGKAVAQKLATDGYNIILLARNEEKLKNTLAELYCGAEQNHAYLVGDFSKPFELRNVIKQYVKKGNAVDILVNNTGGPKGGPIVDASAEEFLDTFNKHLVCNHLLMQAVVDGMKANGFGRIVNIISTSVKQPLPNLGVSNTIRGAVANWSKTLANELGQYGITVNNVLPGATNTSRLQEIAQTKSDKTGAVIEEVFDAMASESPMKRIAEPEEIAAAVGFLVSDQASYVNGINIPVDGGRTKSL